MPGAAAGTVQAGQVPGLRGIERAAAA